MAAIDLNGTADAEAAPSQPEVASSDVISEVPQPEPEISGAHTPNLLSEPDTPPAPEGCSGPRVAGCGPLPTSVGDAGPPSDAEGPRPSEPGRSDSVRTADSSTLVGMIHKLFFSHSSFSISANDYDSR